MITVQSKGSFKNLDKFLATVSNREQLYSKIEPLAKEGVSALAAATPTESGKTAASWDYEIKISNKSVSITWLNTNTIDGVNIAVILQYGHGTGTGGYVQGRDYINPAIKPIFDKIAESVWRVVTSA